MSNAANQTSNININVPRRPPPLYHVQLVQSWRVTHTFRRPPSAFHCGTKMQFEVRT